MITKDKLDKKTLTAERIAKKHRVSVEYIKKQLVRGIQVEKEHTSDPEVAREIALDHLGERPDYYIRLEKVEEELNLNDVLMLFEGIEDALLERAPPSAPKRDRTQYRWFRNNPRVEAWILANKDREPFKSNPRLLYGHARKLYNKWSGEHTLGRKNTELKNDSERMERYKVRKEKAVAEKQVKDASVKKPSRPKRNSFVQELGNTLAGSVTGRTIGGALGGDVGSSVGSFFGTLSGMARSNAEERAKMQKYRQQLRRAYKKKYGEAPPKDMSQNKLEASLRTSRKKKINEALMDKLRAVKTSVVKTVVPKPVRDVAAGAALYGKSIGARMDGHQAVADRMRRKAGQWAMGNRKEPDPDGQWNGMHSSRGDQLKKRNVNEMFWKKKAEPKAPKGPSESARKRAYGVFADGSKGEIRDLVHQYRRHLADKPADSAPPHVKSNWESERNGLRDGIENAKYDYGKWTAKARTAK